MPTDTVPLTRSLKKARTRDRILANSIALFRKQGVRGTRLSEVAVASEIAPATLFNYFPTKGRLAEAWVRGELEEILVKAVEDAVDRDRSLRAAIRTACRDIAIAASLEPALRLEAWHESGRAPDRPADATRRLVSDLVLEQKRDRVRADIPAHELAATLIDAIEGGLIAGLQSAEREGPWPMTDPAGAAASSPGERPTSGPNAASTAGPSTLGLALARSIRVRVDLVLDGFRKRNERVSASSGRATSSASERSPAPST